jgi:hypothetical protein
MGTDAFNEENNGENGMRQAIIKAVFRAISVFLILYFLTVGFQVVGWLHSDPMEGINDSIIWPNDLPFTKANQIDFYRENGLLRFTPNLWPLAGHWYLYR